MLLVTFGAEGRAVDDLRRVVARHGVSLVIDVRRSPAGQNREWGPVALAQALGSKGYAWVRGLSVKNLRSGLAAGHAPAYVDLAGGLREVAPRFARGERAWLLLGEAPDPMHDARGHLAAQLQAELSGIAVIHDQPEVVSTQEGLW